MTRQERLPQPDQRAAPLEHMRNLKMARSVHAYVRGSTEQFYAWLEKSRDSLPKGPPVWICGDCHLSNIGPIADSDGETNIQIRDLDQAVVGNPAHDLVRLAVSLAMAARSSDLPGVIVARMIEDLILGYETETAAPSANGNVKAKRPETIQVVMRRAVRRTWKKLAKERIDGTDPQIPLSKKFWPISETERDELSSLMNTEEVRRLATRLKCRSDGDAVRMLDAAYWVKGCSSLGNLRYAVLLRVGSSTDPESSLCLIDVKQARPSAAPRVRAARMPRNEGERVVAAARALAPNLGERTLAATIQGHPVFIRELRPQDLKIEVERLSQTEAQEMARFLGAIVGRAHARQMKLAARKQWLAELKRQRPHDIDAPSWLWRSVVALVQAHEGGYLEHCRQFTNAESPG